MIDNEKLFREALDTYYLDASITKPNNYENILRHIDRCRSYLSAGNKVTGEWINANSYTLRDAFLSFKRLEKISLNDTANLNGLSSIWELDDKQLEKYQLISDIAYELQKI